MEWESKKLKVVENEGKSPFAGSMLFISA